MATTEAQARRAVKRSRIRWDSQVADSRHSTNQVHPHHGLLTLLAGAFACGRIPLRKVEDFSVDLGPEGRRRVGLARAVSDSTLYRLLQDQGPEGLRETVWGQAHALERQGRLKNDLFPVGVLTGDGKLLWSSTGSSVEGAKISVDRRAEVITSSLMSLRLVLTSSAARPCLDFEVIGEKAGEAPAFRVSFPRVVEEFGHLFEVATGDAGLACRENSTLVRGAKKHFVWSLKGNQGKLMELAEKRFSGPLGPALAQSEDQRSGFWERRELHAVTLTVEEKEEVDFPEGTQLWRVRRQVGHGDWVTSEEVRYFVTSLPAGRFSRAHELALVRLHWGIENGHNWTMDMALMEDDLQPCQQSKEAIEVVGWLRVLGYNLLAAFRAEAPLKDRLPLPWQRCMDLLRDAFCPKLCEVCSAQLG
jgi:hypothetical protein